MSSLSKLCEPEMWLAILAGIFLVFFCPDLASETCFKLVGAISRVWEGGKGRKQQGGPRKRWERRSKDMGARNCEHRTCSAPCGSVRTIHHSLDCSS